MVPKKVAALGTLNCENPSELKNRKTGEAVGLAAMPGSYPATAKGSPTKGQAKKAEKFGRKAEALTKKLLKEVIREATTSAQVILIF